MNDAPIRPRRRPWWRALAAAVMVAGFVLCAWSGFELGIMLVVGVLLVIGGVALQGAAMARATDARHVDRRYAREFFLAMAGYIVIVALVWPQVEHVGSLWLKVVIGLLPIVPTVFVARAIVRRIRDGDELERRVQLEAAAMAGLVVGITTFCLGFLQLSGVLPPLRGDLILVYPFLCAVWGLAQWWSRRRFR